MRREIVSFVMSVMIVLNSVLCACGSSKIDTMSIDSEKVALQSSIQKGVSKGQIPLSEAVRENGIWYYVENPELGKDADVKTAYIFKNGQLYVYDLSEKKLGDFADLSENEIMNIIHEEGIVGELKGEKYTEERLISEADEAICELPILLKNISLRMSLYNDRIGIMHDYTNYDSTFAEKFYQVLGEKMENIDISMFNYSSHYELGIETEATGDEIKGMMLNIDQFDLAKSFIPSSYIMHKVCKRDYSEYFEYLSYFVDDYGIDQNHVETFDPLSHNGESRAIYLSSMLVEPIQVNDTCYSGFQVGLSQGNAVFITQSASGAVVVFDEIDSEGIIINPEWNVQE